MNHTQNIFKGLPWGAFLGICNTIVSAILVPPLLASIVYNTSLFNNISILTAVYSLYAGIISLIAVVTSTIIIKKHPQPVTWTVIWFIITSLALPFAFIIPAHIYLLGLFNS